MNKQAEELDEQITNFLWDFFEASVEQAVNQLSHGRKSKESVIANTRPKLISIFQAEKERAVKGLELEVEMLQGQLDNLDNWFIRHPNDSLLDFMANHVSSFVYDKRLAELQKGDSDARS